MVVPKGIQNKTHQKKEIIAVRSDVDSFLTIKKETLDKNAHFLTFARA